MLKTNKIHTKSPKNFEKPDKTLNQIRTTFLLWFTIDLISFTYYWGIQKSLSRFLIFLTNWGYSFTFFFLLLSHFKIFQAQTIFKTKFFHICLALEFLITVFYWFILYHSAEFDDFYQHFFAITRHLLPLVYLVMEFVGNKLVLNRSSFWSLVCVLFVYCFSNFFLNVFLEVEIYTVITWKDLKSLVYIFAAVGLSFVGWASFMFLQKFKFVV